MKKELNLFLKEKPIIILIALKKMQRKKYSSKISREVNCTYAHTTKILQELEDMELIQIEKNGRINDIKLTKKGDDVAEHMIEIQEIMK